jgi:nicotinate-nucleotide adenylyltransferase
MRIGICGGTFDPFHRGHLDPVLAVRDVMEWSRIDYIPAWRQPFKADAATTSGYHRFAMAVLATRAHDDVYVRHWELDRGTISYTVETLEMLRTLHPAATLDWIIGDDNLAQLGEWKNIERIFELANFAVLSRLGPDTEVPAPYRRRVTSPSKRGLCGAIVIAPNQTVPISATEIRRKVRSGESVAGLVDPDVSHYIQHYRLYREVQT